MFTDSELDYMNEEYKVLLNETMIKHKRYSITLFFLVIILTASALFFTIDVRPWNTLVPTYGIFFLGGAIFYIIFSFKLGISKPFYNIVVSKVVNKLNYNLNLSLKYSSDSSIEFDHNKTGGIFSRFCKSKVRMHIKGLSIENNHFDLFDLSLITGGGNNKKVHLDGIYVVTRNKTNIIQQIRTNGMPHLKGVKYKRIEEEFQYKLYLSDETDSKIPNKRYSDMFLSVMNDTMYKKVYMSVIESETHFAIHKFKLYKYKKINMENMNNLYKDIECLIKLVDSISIKEF